VRWWDGRAWTVHTAHASDSALAASVRTREPFRPLPAVAAWWGLAVTVAALVGARVVLELLGRFDWPIILYAGLAAILGYGPMVAYSTFASRRWGTGSLATDLGLRLRWNDLAWAPVIWLSAWAGGIVAAIVVLAVRLPMTSNTEGIDDYAGDRGVLIAFLIVAVVVAPVAEEMMFRGVVMRGLASVAPIGLAIAGQGLFFGAAHVDPVRGWGNLGLMLVLAAVGVVFGGATYLLRRLGPAIAGHALYNAAVLAIVLLLDP
jgi:membrane protease YdiL (CAAX protease family)